MSCSRVQESVSDPPLGLKRLLEILKEAAALSVRSKFGGERAGWVIGGFAHCKIVNRRNRHQFKTTDEHQWCHLDRRLVSQPQASALVGQKHIVLMGGTARRTPTAGAGAVRGMNEKESWYRNVLKMFESISSVFYFSRESRSTLYKHAVRAPSWIVTHLFFASTQTGRRITCCCC